MNETNQKRYNTNDPKCPHCGGTLSLFDHLPLDMTNIAFDDVIYAQSKCDTCEKITELEGDIKWKIV